MENSVIEIQKRLEEWGRSCQNLEKIKYRTYTKNYTSDLSETFPKKKPNEFIESFYEFDHKEEAVQKKNLENIRVDLRSFLEEEFNLHSSGLSQKVLDRIWGKTNSMPFLSDPFYAHIAISRYRCHYRAMINQLNDLGVITLETKGESDE